MFTIDKFNKIKLTKGDTATMLIEIVDADRKPYEIKSTDVITMTVRKTASTAAASLSKTATADHHIIFESSDTSNLNNGLYVYDIQLDTADGNRYTIVPSSYFELTQEITR